MQEKKLCEDLEHESNFHWKPWILSSALSSRKCYPITMPLSRKTWQIWKMYFLNGLLRCNHWQHSADSWLLVKFKIFMFIEQLMCWRGKRSLICEDWILVYKRWSLSSGHTMHKSLGQCGWFTKVVYFLLGSMKLYSHLIIQ